MVLVLVTAPCGLIVNNDLVMKKKRILKKLLIDQDAMRLKPHLFLRWSGGVPLVLVLMTVHGTRSLIVKKKKVV